MEFFVGLAYRADDGEGWRWLDGTPLDFTAWGAYGISTPLFDKCAFVMADGFWDFTRQCKLDCGWCNGNDERPMLCKRAAGAVGPPYCVPFHVESLCCTYHVLWAIKYQCKLCFL